MPVGQCRRRASAGRFARDDRVADKDEASKRGRSWARWRWPATTRLPDRAKIPMIRPASARWAVDPIESGQETDSLLELACVGLCPGPASWSHIARHGLPP